MIDLLDMFDDDPNAAPVQTAPCLAPATRGGNVCEVGGGDACYGLGTVFRCREHVWPGFLPKRPR